MTTNGNGSDHIDRDTPEQHPFVLREEYEDLLGAFIFNTLSGEYLFEPLEGACKVLVKLADGSEFAKELT